MPTYVLMTKLGPEIASNLKSRRKRGEEWKRTVAAKCPKVKWIAHYALLGPYDFMDLYDAPDSETAARVSLLTRSLGAISAESWTAVPYTDFLKIVEKL
ncbi:MAG: GYD domain-containing protein [Pseudomonadota bacterium]